VSVAAERCLVADALTKVVLANSAPSGLLAAFGAQAWMHDARCGWRPLSLAA
ncbi:MAG: hypothetical protein JSS13_05700, partial [Proteobacteria bacterium]|nr:hypothetical protein [Pseudomonadota bacterium]